MRKLSQFSVNYPITVLMFVLAVILLGYTRIFVELRAGERPPEEMERQFVEGIESIAIRQKNVIDIVSVSKVGMAQITVEYTWDADMDEAFLDLQKSLTNFAQNSELDEMNISQHDPNSSPVMLIGLSHSDISDMDELRKIAENYLRNELTRLEGIAAVEIIGGEMKEVVVETSPYLMDAYGLDLSMIASRIQNANITASGGSIVELGLKYIIKGVGEFRSIEDIGNVIVAEKLAEEGDPELVPVYLKEIADIKFGNKDPENFVRINGTRCIALAVYKETRYNTVTAVHELSENLKNLRKALPGYEFRILQNQAEFIDIAISEVERTALFGILLAIFILYIFLRRIGTTTIISVAIPISIIATFNLMYFNGLTLNIMTLGGLALGAGMLVDNAIVVMENIFRNLEGGLSLKEAAVTGTSQVAGAITASTLTTIVVFLPIVYLHGAAGELFKDQAWTVAFSLVSSLAVAIFVIPMLSHKLLRVSSKRKRTASLGFDWYYEILDRILIKRWWVIIGALSLILLTLAILPIIGSEFMPQGETNDFQIEVVLDEGTSLEHMDRVATQIEDLVRTLIASRLAGIYTRVGPLTETLSEQTSTDLQDANSAILTVYLNPDLNESTDDIIARIQSALAQNPDWEIRFYREQSSLQETLGTDQAPVVVEVKGEDLHTIRALTEELKMAMENIKDLVNIESSFEEGRPEINIVFDRIRAGMYNLDFATVGTQLKEQLQGKLVGNWENEGEMRDITVNLPDMSLQQMDDLYIYDGQRKIRLDEIADIQAGIGETEINRRNQVRVGIISAQIRGGEALDQIAAQIKDKLQQINFPQNYSYEISGEELQRQRSFSNLKFALLLSIILIYMVLASQFESLIHPFTILLTIPLAVVGAVLIFFFLQLPLNVMAYIGIILLIGIAVNDSIILVDAINQLRRQGKTLRESILEAGQRRIRPIIMTSLTTILALFPLTLGFGESAALRSPMALAVIGGLVTSTLLTLVVIPCVYYVLDRAATKIKIIP
jgi:HAE1 family hydrophobic/amphiphilic exporter-1